ncbi:MAG TPA: hypothetical protein DCR20_08150 [Planctomycetaceae bacterium]|nr:hypothetical protein [Planctomycetaceae bacterium]
MKSEVASGVMIAVRVATGTGGRIGGQWSVVSGQWSKGSGRREVWGGPLGVGVGNSVELVSVWLWK